MKAVRIRRFGDPGVLALEDVDIPTPGDGEALIRISASGVGPWDAWIRAGRSVLPQPLPLTLGSDIAGVVESVGRHVHDIVPGQRVFGVTNKQFTGGYAEFAVADAGMLAAAPTRFTFAEAASVPVIAVTAWQMLFEHARVQARQQVLILGADGNVGRYAVQLANQARIHVHTLSRHDQEETTFRSLAGAIDAVIDTVGGATQTQALTTLKVGGLLVSAVSAPGEAQLSKYRVRGHFMLVDVDSARLQRIAELLQQGQLTPLVGTVLPLASARIAHEMLDGERSGVRGKIVLQP